jgi:hypothetical protein
MTADTITAEEQRRACTRMTRERRLSSARSAIAQAHGCRARRFVTNHGTWRTIKGCGRAASSPASPRSARARRSARRAATTGIRLSFRRSLRRTRARRWTRRSTPTRARRRRSRTRARAAPAPAIPADSPRILVVGPHTPDAALLAADLAGILAADSSFKSSYVESAYIETGQGTSLMNFFYSPDGRDARLAPLSDAWTYVVILDQAAFALSYSEFHFEGVRTIACRVRTAGATPIVLSTWSNASGENATRSATAYRVGNGTGSPVVPAANAWELARADAGALPAEAAVYVAAASLYSAITGRGAADASSPFVPAKLDATVAARLASAARDAVAADAKASHYTSPFGSVVSMQASTLSSPYTFMDSGTSSEAIWEQRMIEILSKMTITPNATTLGNANATKTFDANELTAATPYFQKAQYAILFARDYSVDAATIRGAGAQSDLQVQVWDRHADSDPNDGIAAVAMMESMLTAKYDEAKSLELAHIPYHLMFAKLKTARPAVNLLSDGVHATYPVGYGLAVMSIVARAAKTPPTNGLDADTLAAAQFADETIRQLSALSASGAPTVDDPATRPKIR